MADRDQMMRDIEMEVEYTRHLIGRDALDARVMEAMHKVSRHEFVPPGVKAHAYCNGPVRIGYGQTISQPYIVALMTDLLEPEPDDVILEVGTGSGYQAGILGLLVKQIYTIEIVEALSERAAALLRRHKYSNIKCRVGNGYFGWPEHAPFDGIVVTAAAPTIPHPLVEQLRPGGKLVIPVGLPHYHQELMVVEKDEKGKTKTHDILGVAFVPLTGDHEGGQGE